MGFNPNQLLNNPASLLSIRSQAIAAQSQEPAAPVPPPPYDKGLYRDAYSRLGLLRIDNVADLGCGVGNFTGVMTEKKQRPEVYLGVDSSHANVKVAKAAYPGWNFIYGDFNSPQVRQEYERYDAYLLLGVLDVIEDDLGFLESAPSGKPILFSAPRAPKEGSLRHFPDMYAIRERYSGLLSVKTVGRFRSAEADYSMVVGVRW
ncbi:MAG: methyltransferase domain-containing protein [Deltaproteobacteria bacterium]|jgi:SAM-dependent methyltransferase|nr:methyltransferase domain-containing protein [Deltaproteobacteria bacterium]